MNHYPPSMIGFVIIGRNEGDRLERCLRSVAHLGGPVVYVDSGSIDQSVARARSLGAMVVELDSTVSFTMARGRNAGARTLLNHFPTLQLLQFIDGDCELIDGYLSHAVDALAQHPQVAVVCGRRLERYPDASIYNRLASMEWNAPVGFVRACGGDALYRTAAFNQVGGFNEQMIAGEEPELCVRLLQHGWQVLRIDQPMTLHDANMHHFRQWWRRCMRGGHAFAQGAALHGRTPQRHSLRSLLSTLAWGLLLPCVVLVTLLTAGAPSLGPVAAGLWLGIVLQLARIYRSRRTRGDGPAHAALYSLFCLVGKLPQLLGALLYWRRRVGGIEPQLIEYRTGASAP